MNYIDVPVLDLHVHSTVTSEDQFIDLFIGKTETTETNKHFLRVQ